MNERFREMGRWTMLLAAIYLFLSTSCCWGGAYAAVTFGCSQLPRWKCSCGLKRRGKMTSALYISSVLPVSADLFRSRFQLLIWGSCIIRPCWWNKLERWSLSHGHLGPTTPRARLLIWFCRNRLFNATWNAVFVPICSKWAVISEQWAVRQTPKTNTHRLPSASLTELVVT